MRGLTISQADQDAPAANPRWAPRLNVSTYASIGTHVHTHLVAEAARILFRFGIWPAAVAIWGHGVMGGQAVGRFLRPEDGRFIDGGLTAAGMEPLPLAPAEKEVITLEGLGTEPHPIQRAFLEGQAAQCGYCINGMIMAAKAFLDRNPHPTEQEIRRELAGNLCRCSAHVEILRAVGGAAQAPETSGRR